ncbi:SURF1 family protein [Sphingomonas sp.]|uniref:SURF1 family protein n=1 Tax=Sphingomonas sp. TaxID=28214 RepID=UPI001B256CF0|nr:SURF1 family protein [Sphingomonas sp.]MBO9712999.1 SURF1 family protein [Sphingomonas sp.]
MPRLPVLPTILVGLAVAAMIALGVWQLERKQEKEALLAQLAANFDKPEMAFPRVPLGDQYLFRRASALCLEPTGWRHEGGGANGFRLIAECRTGAEGPPLLVMVGASRDPQFTPQWKGGPVEGTITHVPGHDPLIVSLFSSAPKQLMLVTDTPVPGLNPVPKPSLDSVPNNHLAYAVQWFLFAVIAVAIYLLALKRRQASQPKS